MPRRAIIRRPNGPIRCTIELPRSKSIANRALVLASLAGDLSCVHAPGDADDTRILHKLLLERPRLMHCGAGGTTFRFLLAWACVQEGEEHVLTGDARLLERPHDDLIDALRSLGASIERTEEGYRVRGTPLKGGTITLDSPISSQFISALLLIAPCMQEGLGLRWKGKRLSEPYVRMTVKCLAHFGVAVEVKDDVIRVAPTKLIANAISIPRDWSAASFWFEIAALWGAAQITLKGLHRDGWQGDEAIASFMRPFCSVEHSSDGIRVRPLVIKEVYRLRIDLTDTPDLFQPIAAVCMAHGLSAKLSGLHNLSVKETDRLQAMTDAFATVDFPSAVQEGSWTTPGRTWSSSEHVIIESSGLIFDPRDDHRMAMSLAPLATRWSPLTILDPDVVNKSYPAFWADLRSAGFTVDIVEG